MDHKERQPIIITTLFPELYMISSLYLPAVACDLFKN